jgi:hypothetical protein
MRAPISAAIAIAFGLIVLLGYFVPLPLLSTLRSVLLQWGVIIAAVALFVGVGNLFYVHWRKISRNAPGSSYSFVVIIALIATLVVAGLFGPTGYWPLWIFNNIQLPIEMSLLALLPIVLIFAVARLLRRRANLFSLTFVAALLIVMLGTAPILGVEIPGLNGPLGLRSLTTQILSTAGARGILLGVALGTIATGLRVLMGVDRPYGG